MNSYHSGRFEWFVVATVIATISAVALGRYLAMADDAQNLRLEILSHRLVTAAANARAEFLVKGLSQSQTRSLPIAGQPVYFSFQGWPVAVTAPVVEGFRLQEADCVALWNLLLQNPPPLGLESRPEHKAEYVLSVGDSVCRFQLHEAATFFDYYPLEGRVIFSRGSISGNL